MKKLILLLMLCKGCVAFGQQNINYWTEDDEKQQQLYDSMIKVYKAVGMIRDTGIFIYYDPKPIIDTMPCLMLVTDTGFDATNGILQDSYWVEQPAPFAYYLKGYEVRKSFDSYLTVDEHGNKIENPFWSHKQYLDYDKHPLPKNVVVWMNK